MSGVRHVGGWEKMVRGCCLLTGSVAEDREWRKGGGEDCYLYTKEPRRFQRLFLCRCVGGVHGSTSPLFWLSKQQRSGLLLGCLAVVRVLLEYLFRESVCPANPV